MPFIAGAVDVAVGNTSHACAVVTGGQVMCWGQNDKGELLDDRVGVHSRAPVKLSAGEMGGGASSALDSVLRRRRQ
ncbi:hypothetical protein BH09MYX1_BH09MYX1_04940 [soil metagenome]